MRTGGAPATSRAVSARAASRCAGSSSWWTVAARRRAAAVLPTPFGPSMTSAGRSASRTSSSSSMMRGA